MSKEIKGALQCNLVTSCEEKLIFGRYERFLGKTYYSTITNFDKMTEFETRKSKLSRLSKIWFIKISCMLMTLRCFVNIFFPTEFIKNITCNAYHYLGNSALINLGLFTAGLATPLILGTTHQYFISSGQSYQFEYMHKIKYKRLDYRLNNEFNNKFYRKFNWISRGVSTLFLPSMLMQVLLHLVPLILGRFDPRLDFNDIGNFNITISQ